MEQAKAKLMREFGWSENRAYHAIRIASSMLNRSMEAVADDLLLGGQLPEEAVRASEEVWVPRSRLESLRRLVHGRAATIVDSLLEKVK